ncbi:uncharacterized protein LOC125277480 [Megalobrama amblycephala]|uniref:uncharacterized protein LOC125277480 n=1 Tax=Megalobrama amblycephala TaxID=75352 RepID=UPI00201430ED|nr:uncharacterized protein LOC125277480 [Megalobrama amblycephala]
MPSLPFLNIFGRQLTQMSIVTSVPMTFSLVGLQAVMDVKFSCPCKAYWNMPITAFIFIVPAFFAFIIMFILLRPIPFKYSCSQKQNNIEASRRNKDCEETSQGHDNKETPQEHLKYCIKCRVKTFLVCLIPSLVWICIFLIDGDYIACGFTNWNGRYACDKELHPYCLNWCKPTELSSEKNETKCYERTRELIYISKISGYVLALIFCIITIILVTFDWDGSLISKSSSTGSSTSAEPNTDKSNKDKSDNLPMRSIGSTPEQSKSLIPRQGGRGEGKKEEEEEEEEEGNKEE